MLGQSIEIEYGWFAGAPKGWPEAGRVLRRIHIDFDVEGAESVDLVRATTTRPGRSCATAVDA